MIEYDNHDPDNTGLVLWLDIINPAILIVLYLISGRKNQDAIRSAPDEN